MDKTGHKYNRCLEMWEGNDSGMRKVNKWPPKDIRIKWGLLQLFALKIIFLNTRIGAQAIFRKRCPVKNTRFCLILYEEDQIEP